MDRVWGLLIERQPLCIIGALTDRCLIGNLFMAFSCAVAWKVGGLNSGALHGEEAI